MLNTALPGKGSHPPNSLPLKLDSDSLLLLLLVMVVILSSSGSLSTTPHRLPLSRLSLHLAKLVSYCKHFKDASTLASLLCSLPINTRLMADSFHKTSFNFAQNRIFTDTYKLNQFKTMRTKGSISQITIITMKYPSIWLHNKWEKPIVSQRKIFC